MVIVTDIAAFNREKQMREYLAVNPDSNEAEYLRMESSLEDWLTAEREKPYRQERDATAAETAATPTWQEDGDGHVLTLGRRDARRCIHGIASSSTINSHGYALISRGMDAVLPVPLLSSHQGHASPIGEIFHVRRTVDRIYVRAEIFDTEAASYAWELIKNGSIRCFSGAALPSSMKVQGIVEGKTFYGSWTLQEVSICPVGANPDCHFEILRSGDMATHGSESFVSLPYGGVWRSDTSYKSGQFVTDRGNLWYCRTQNKNARPGDEGNHAFWTMAVRRGRLDDLEKQHRKAAT